MLLLLANITQSLSSGKVWYVSGFKPEDLLGVFTKDIF